MGQPAAALQQKPRTSLVGANHGSAIRGSAKSTPSIHSQEPENLVQPAAFHVVRRGPGQSPSNPPSSHSSSLHHPPGYLGPVSNPTNKHFVNSDGSSNHSQVSSGKRGRDIADVGRKEGQKRPKVWDDVVWLSICVPRYLMKDVRHPTQQQTSCWYRCWIRLLCLLGSSGYHALYFTSE